MYFIFISTKMEQPKMNNLHTLPNVYNDFSRVDKNSKHEL